MTDPTYSYPSNPDLPPPFHPLITPLTPPPSEPSPSIPPQSLDFLPPLHSLLTTLTNSLSLSVDASTTSGAVTTIADPKDISHQTNFLRLKLSKTRDLISQLPDIHKSIEEQEEEANELEGQVKRQTEVIRRVICACGSIVGDKITAAAVVQRNTEGDVNMATV